MKNHGFVRVAAATPMVEVGNPHDNASQMAWCIEEAEKNHTSLLVFPELSVTSYSCADLFFNETLQHTAQQALLDLSAKTKGKTIVALVGVPVLCQSKLFNCAAVLFDGQVRGFAVKRFIPNHAEFYEARWFCSADELQTQVVPFAGKEVPIGADLIFSTGEYQFAAEICEDLWSDMPSSVALARAGAEIICNCAASNALAGKSEDRNMLVRHRSSVSHCGYVFCSAGITESTTDTLYSGHRMVYECGTLLEEGEQKEFTNLISYADLDLGVIRAQRRKNTSFQAGPAYRMISLSQPLEPFALARHISQTPFLSDNVGTQMKEIVDIQALSLAKRLRHTGLHRMVIGISGGLDSTLALLVCAKTADQLKWTRDSILAVTMPGFGTTGRTLENARNLMKLLGVEQREISIASACEKHFSDIGQDAQNKDVTYENAQARERTQILLDLSNKEGGLMVGTGDLSELALGFTTYSGDHMSMYGVNAGVPKTMVQYLVHWFGGELNAEAATVLNAILQTPISPELLPPDSDGKIAQKTEQLLGDYQLHDFFLYYFLQYGFAPEKIEFLAKHAFAKQYDNAQIHRCLLLFIKRFFSQQFKRSCMPDGPKVLEVSLSPRSDWRMPSDCDSTVWLESLE